MIWMIGVFLLTVSILLTIRIKATLSSLQYHEKLEGFKRLERIYVYLLNYQKNPEQIRKNLDKDIVIEGTWLYTNTFYFDLKNGMAWDRMRGYFLDHFDYLLWSKKKNLRDKGVKQLVLSYNSAESY